MALKQEDPRIVPDMGVRVAFLEAAAPAVAAKPGVLVPAAAISERDGSSIAFVVVDGKAQQRVIKPGRSLGDDREVLEGLAGGDVVVLEPPADLVDGTRVQVVPTDTAPGEDPDNE